MSAPVSDPTYKPAVKRAGVWYPIALAVVIQIYQKHVPAPFAVPWIINNLDPVLWICGAILLGQIVRCATVATKDLYRGLRQGVWLQVGLGRKIPAAGDGRASNDSADFKDKQDF